MASSFWSAAQSCILRRPGRANYQVVNSPFFGLYTAVARLSSLLHQFHTRWQRKKRRRRSVQRRTSLKMARWSSIGLEPEVFAGQSSDSKFGIAARRAGRSSACSSIDSGSCASLLYSEPPDPADKGSRSPTGTSSAGIAAHSFYLHSLRSEPEDSAATDWAAGSSSLIVVSPPLSCFGAWHQGL